MNIHYAACDVASAVAISSSITRLPKAEIGFNKCGNSAVNESCAWFSLIPYLIDVKRDLN